MRLIINHTFKLLKDERGAILFIVAAAMVSLLGVSALVTDIGLIAANRQKLVNTMDSAALAGALELPNAGSAVTVARQYAVNNNYVSQNASDPQVTVSGNSITVQGIKQVNLVFARIFGWNSSNVSASATARVQALTGLRGVLPLTVSEQYYIQRLNDGAQFDIKTDTPSIGSGNFGAVSLANDPEYDPQDRSANGAATYRANLVSGSSQIIRVGDPILTKPGNMDGPTRKGVKERVNNCNCTIDTYFNHTNCPRVGFIPLFKETPYNINGRTNVTVSGFAAVFITNVGNDYNPVTAKALGNVIKDGESSLTQVNFGVTKPVLVN